MLSLPVIAAGNDILNQAYQHQTQGKSVVTGTVMNENSQPVAGATIIVKGNPALGATITDQKGAFRFEAPVGTVLQFSFVGYGSEEKTVDGSRDWIVVMKESSQILEDVVVVGYGVQRKESVIGAISQITSEDLVTSGTSNITNALSGKIPGMLVYSTSGAPGENDSSMLIRGLSSWNGSSPLVMVDGIERDMKALSPNEVASISVLKDASATAVYGAKGANGVILITTKTGNKGKPKFNINVEYGALTPLFIPAHINAPTVAKMANVAYKNAQSFGSIFSDDVIRQYADQSNPIRYPDVNWYDMMLRDFGSEVNANLSLSGGSEKIRYYLGAGYVYEGSILKNIHEYGNTNFTLNKFNYRFNMDWNVTKTTALALKVGGITSFEKRLASHSNSSELFSTMYQSPGITFPAFYSAKALELYPDPDYPDWKGNRIADNQGLAYENPYSFLSDPSFRETMTNRLMTDIILDQKLDFITKGLSVKLKTGLTSLYTRIAKDVNMSNPRWDINWDAVDAGTDNPWITSSSSNYVWNDKPYEVTQTNVPGTLEFITYFEGSISYDRRFSRSHNITALALYNQRQYNSGASFPKRNQSFVGRATYDYKGKYLFEANLGITGSEQFSPKNRYGVFPSIAVGYFISKEPFWEKAMPWWSTMKIRYSNGKVGSDAAGSNWLYYSSWSTVRGYYVEDAAANETARWETANKQDLGLEMGWMKNTLKLTLDFYKENREDMLLPPVVTAFVGVKYKDVNAGAMKKHGMEIELSYSNSTAKGFRYTAGVMFGISENRITKYADPPYAPDYQKWVDTQYGSPREGSTLVDDKYFNTIDELHGYPLYTTEWTNVTPGAYKFLDYYPNGAINQSDLHVLNGSTYAPTVYSFNVGGSYKGLSFKVLCTGTIGKYINYRRAAIVPFYAGSLVVHKTQLDYWRPDNRNSAVPSLMFNDQMYSWAGGTSTYPGYSLALPGYTWRRSDYLSIKEVMVSYSFNGPKIKRALGVETLSIGLTCNNLWTFTNLVDVDPQRLTTATNYYPTMRVLELNVNLSF